jgi:hypothetical protein
MFAWIRESRRLSKIACFDTKVREPFLLFKNRSIQSYGPADFAITKIYM